MGLVENVPLFLAAVVAILALPFSVLIGVVVSALRRTK